MSCGKPAPPSISPVSRGSLRPPVTTWVVAKIPTVPGRALWPSGCPCRADGHEGEAHCSGCQLRRRFQTSPQMKTRKQTPPEKRNSCPGGITWSTHTCASRTIFCRYRGLQTICAIKAQNKHPTPPGNRLMCHFMAADSSKKIRPATAACPGGTSVPLPLETTPVVAQDPRNAFREAGARSSTAAMRSGSPADPGRCGRDGSGGRCRPAARTRVTVGRGQGAGFPCRPGSCTEGYATAVASTSGGVS